MNSEEKLLDESKKEFFHTITAKLLYIMKRARPDIELAVFFLCTRVRDPNIDDWKKLKRVLGWLESTINDTGFIGVNSLNELFK